MKLIVLLTLSIFIVQLNSCASQDTGNKESPSNKNHKSSEKITKRKTIKKPKGDKIVVSPDSVNVSDEIVEEDVEMLEDEDGLMGKSVITYTNIIEVSDSKKGTANGGNASGAARSEAKKESEKDDLPVQGQKVKLLIQNNHATAMWYLMPISGEKEMPVNGKFAANPEVEPPFLAKKYEQSGQQLVELIYHGQEGQSFRAFYVEAGRSLLFRNYDLGTYREGDYVPFWSAQKLDVNDKISLKDWLPFSVLSSPDIVMHNTTESGPAKWKNLGVDANFPSEKVKYIQAAGIKRYQIPVGVLR